MGVKRPSPVGGSVNPTLLRCRPATRRSDCRPHCGQGRLRIPVRLDGIGGSWSIRICIGHGAASCSAAERTNHESANDLCGRRFFGFNAQPKSPTSSSVAACSAACIPHLVGRAAHTAGASGAAARPNPSLNHRARYGGPSWPRLGYAVHSPSRAKPFHRSGPVRSNVRLQYDSSALRCTLNTHPSPKILASHSVLESAEM